MCRQEPHIEPLPWTIVIKAVSSVSFHLKIIHHDNRSLPSAGNDLKFLSKREIFLPVSI
jgi:hypothetical protein